MGDISKLNLTGSDLDIKDSFMRSITPSTASTSNKLATIADVSGGGGGSGFTATKLISGQANAGFTSSTLDDTYDFYLMFHVKEDKNIFNTLNQYDLTYLNGVMFIPKDIIKLFKNISYGNFYIVGVCATNPLDTSITFEQFGIAHVNANATFRGPANTYTQLYGCKWN